MGSCLRLGSPTLLLLGGTLLAAGKPSGTILGRVVSVAEGDLLTVVDNSYGQHKVRLYGVDAPEPRQRYGTLAREELYDKVSGKSVRVEVASIDRHGRQFGRVYLGDRYINLEMVEEGLAWRFPPSDKGGEFIAAQNDAIARKRGLWADANPVPPWKFRGEK